MSAEKKYKQYKDSGIDWLGKVPEQWNLTKVKYFYDVCLGKMVQPSKQNSSDTLEPYLCSVNVNWEGINIDNVKSMWCSSNDKIKYAIQSGDLIVNEGGDAGRAGIWEGQIDRCYIQNAVHRVRGKKNNNNRFLYYWLFTLKKIEHIDMICNRATIMHFTAEKFKNLLFILPSIPEQQAIANFLDHKTYEIDALITDKEKIIELLKEQHQAIITEAVTKGLNPDVKMKGSGNEWIGEIPEHWSVLKFKKVAFFQEGPGLRNWQFTSDGIKVICVTNITENGINFSSYEKFISVEEYLNSYRHFTVNKGDILLSSSGASWGKVTQYLSDEKVILNTSTIRINQKMNCVAIVPYLKYLLLSEPTREQLGLLMTGSCQPNFGPSHLSKVLVAIPTPQEQQRISDYLDNRTRFIDETLLDYEKQIGRLKEYRKSLIYEAVTGKIDVRDWVDKPLGRSDAVANA